MKNSNQNLFIKFSFIIVFTFSVNAQKVETLISNFPANGFLNVDDDGNLYASEYGIFT